MSSWTVLLEPTVMFIHLQQCDELLDKASAFIVVSKNKGPIIRSLEMADHMPIFCGCKAVLVGLCGFSVLRIW